MKKFLIPLIVGLCSCSNEYFDEQIAQEDVNEIEVSIAEMNGEELNSRIVIDSDLNFWWKSNDVLGIFPVNKGSQVEFPLDLEEGEKADKVTFDGGGWAFKGGYTYAGYYPYNILSNRGHKIPFSYAKQSRNCVENDFDLNGNVFFVAGPTAASNGKINFVFYNTESLIRLDLYNLPSDKTYKTLYLSTEDDVIPLEKEYDIFSMEAVKNGNSTVVTIVDEVVSLGNEIEVDLMNAVPVNKMIRVWLAFPAIGNSYGSLTAKVVDSEGNHFYVGDVLVNNSGESFTLNIKRHGKYAAKVTEFEEKNVLVGGIEDWVTDGQEYSGVAE